MGNINSPTSQRNLNAAENKRLALQMRIAGLSYVEIGAKLNVSHVQAFNYVKKSLEEQNKKTAELTSQLIDIENARLNQMRAIIDKKIKDGDLNAIDKALKISKSVRELNGLDRPIKIAETDVNGNDLYNPDIIRNKILQMIERRFLASDEVVENIEDGSDQVNE